MYDLFGPQTAKIVNLLPPKDISAGAHAAAYVNMRNYDHATILVQMGVTGAVGSSKNITFTQAASVSGSSSAALPIKAYWHNTAALGSASTANDTYVRAAVASSGATLALTASTANIEYIFEFDSSELTAGKDCIGVAVATVSAATLCGVTAILTKARQKNPSPRTALSG